MSVYIQGTFVPSWSEFVNRTSRMENNFQRQLERERERARQNAEIMAKREAERTRQIINNQINSAINGVNENIRRIDAENSRRMQRLSDEIFETVGDLRDELRSGLSQVNSRIDNVNERITNVVKQVNDCFDEQDARIGDMETNIQGLYEYIANRQERGRQAVHDARVMAEVYEKISY